MNKPPFYLSLTDPLKYFAKDAPAWKFAALVAVLVTRLAVFYLCCR